MYFNNLKKIREEKEITQQDVAKGIGVNRSSYVNWENNVIMLPIDIADKLSIFFNVRLSLILGVENNISFFNNINPMKYDVMIKNINNLRIKFNYTYEEIATYLDCDKSTCNRYFNKNIIIPTDKIVLLSKLFDIDLDKMCGK